MSAATDVVQAVASTLQALFAGVGLYGLYVYTTETKAIKNAALAQNRAATEQTKAGQRPFFTFGVQIHTLDNSLVVVLKNVGPGHALNVKLDSVDGSAIQLTVGGSAYAVDQECEILRRRPSQDGVALIWRTKGIRVDYTDLAGNPYWTTLRLARTPEGQLVHTYITDSGTGTV